MDNLKLFQSFFFFGISGILSGMLFKWLSIYFFIKNSLCCKSGSLGLEQKIRRHFWALEPIKLLRVIHTKIKITADWLQTGSRLTSDSKIGVSGSVQTQFNPTALLLQENLSNWLQWSGRAWPIFKTLNISARVAPNCRNCHIARLLYR